MVDEAAPLEDRVDPYALFSEQMRIPVRGLAFVGFLQKDIEFCGHVFTLKTLRPSEKAAAALAVQPWRDTIAEPEQWGNAQVAMALVSVDGEPDFCPPASRNINEYAKARLNFVTHPDNGWHSPTLAFLYDEFLTLEKESLAAVEELRNLSERNPAPSQPLPDSLTEPGISDDPIFLDTQP